MPSPRKICIPLVIALTLALAPARPGRRHAAACDQSPSAYGPTYTTGLRVGGRELRRREGPDRKWDDCRRENGGRDGRCRRPGYGFRCSERRSNVISTQYDGRVKCTRGGDVVKFRYTQFT